MASNSACLNGSVSNWIATVGAMCFLCVASAAHFLYLNNIVGGFIDEKKDCKYDFGVRYNLGDHA